jgi:endonuclease-3
MLPAFEAEGHLLFTDGCGLALWTPIVSRFLRQPGMINKVKGFPQPKTENHLFGGPMDPAAKIGPILKLLEQHYPDAHVTLDFANPLELLVATVLSAQCTDVKVNQVTPAIFKKYPTAAAYAEAPLAALEEAVHPTGFFHQKAKSIRAICQALMAKHRGQVPRSLEELVQLPGVGRKTANVILGNAFSVPGIVVDTHCGRVSQRLGLTSQKDPVKIEFDLMALVPRERWTKFSLQLIFHGRAICTAKNPRCPQCPLLPHCDYGQQVTMKSP